MLDLNASRWFTPKVKGTSPPGRYSHTAVLAGQKIIIFGGLGKNGAVFRDLHALDSLTMTWYQGPESSGGPTPRYNHSATLVNQVKMFVFGG